MNPIENKSNTRKTIDVARKSFEGITGRKVRSATIADIEMWMNSLREMGRSASTCRTYLSLVKQLAGLQVAMPKRGKVESRTFTKDEAEKMLSAAKPNNYALVAGLFLCGPDVLTFTWFDVADLLSSLTLEAKMVLINEAKRRGHDTRALLPSGGLFHFVNGPDMGEIIFPQSAHEINRRLKSIARKAGIGDVNVNITAMKNTWKSGGKIASLSAVASKEVVSKRKDTRLHGIGRRSVFMPSA